MSTITINGWTLVHMHNNEPVQIGSIVRDFRGDMHKIKDGTPPHKPSSTGRVYTDRGEFFPSVCDLKWVKPEPQRFSDYVTEDNRDELLAALKTIGNWIGDESMVPVRFDPNSEMHKLIVQLGQDIMVWQQDGVYAAQKTAEQ